MAFVSSAIAALGCGSDPAYPPAPKPPPIEGPTEDPGSVSRPFETPLFSVDVRDPSARPFFLESLTRPARALEAASADTLTAMAVLETGRVEARDASGDLLLLGARLSEGDRARVDLKPAGAECFTAIAHGGIGVMELDVFLVTGPDGDPTIVRDDEKSGPVAVAGGGSACSVTLSTCGPVCWNGDASSVAPRVEVVVRRGSGPVVVGIARKPASPASTSPTSPSPAPAVTSPAPAVTSPAPAVTSPAPPEPSTTSSAAPS